ncbi:NAD-dependent epimerase/dehydratase family protein [Hydrogenovibrio thermophilus]|uniref:NAD(P)-dependent oxidoreductase n=1 Tax=Hydrogenovibrio thermophilus TaxID=265883 RepID=A0A410H4C9_9GAMM|nr:NAD(P)-dependent oxidoreductase [Hydrogenovibrio thermophilus]QAB15783.1 NAD(P)-dependent oxidoreductase [Hydrogenovibrio thermophilus]
MKPNVNGKIFILGWSGYIGQALCKRLEEQGEPVVKVGRNSSSDCIFDLETCNLLALDEVAAGDKFVFLAAISSPEECANNYSYSYKINVAHTSNVIEYLLNKSVHVLFSSSDVVYGRTEAPVDENSPINPGFAYAEMKAEVEKRFLQNNYFSVMRLSYVWSIGDKFTKFLLESSKNESNVEVFDPFVRSVVFLRDVIDFIDSFVVAKDQFPRLVNLSGPEFISRVQLAKEISRFVSFSYTVVHPDENFFKYRPDHIFMTSVYLSSVLKRKPYCMKEAMKISFKEYLEP